MLTSVMKRRFFRYHDHLLAYMDTLEEVAGHLDAADEPGIEFQKYEGLLSEFVQFMKTRESQHEIEEEKVLLPAIEALIEPGTIPGISIDRMIQDHRWARTLVLELEEAMSRLSAKGGGECTPYRIFAKRLQELIWHFRRHIGEENSFILPLADRIFEQDGESAP